MDSNFALYLGRHTLETALMIAAPVLLTCMTVGVLVTLLQAVTSIRDMSLTIVPKLLSVGFVLLVFGGWMLQVLLKFTSEMFSQVQNVLHFKGIRDVIHQADALRQNPGNKQNRDQYKSVGFKSNAHISRPFPVLRPGG